MGDEWITLFPFDYGINKKIHHHFHFQSMLSVFQTVSLPCFKDGNIGI